MASGQDLIKTARKHIGEKYVNRRFSGYVPPEVEASAKARTVQLFGAVETIDPAKLPGTIPAPPNP